VLSPEQYENEVKKVSIPRPSTLMRGLKTQAEANRRKKDLINKQKHLKAIRKDIVNNIRDIRVNSESRLSNTKVSTGIMKAIAGDNAFTRFISTTAKNGIVIQKKELIQAYNHVKVKIDRKDAILDERKESLRKRIIELHEEQI